MGQRVSSNSKRSHHGLEANGGAGGRDFVVVPISTTGTLATSEMGHKKSNVQKQSAKNKKQSSRKTSVTIEENYHSHLNNNDINSNGRHDNYEIATSSPANDIIDDANDVSGFTAKQQNVYVSRPVGRSESVRADRVNRNGNVVNNIQPEPFYYYQRTTSTPKSAYSTVNGFATEDSNDRLVARSSSYRSREAAAAAAGDDAAAGRVTNAAPMRPLDAGRAVVGNHQFVHRRQLQVPVSVHRDDTDYGDTDYGDSNITTRLSTPNLNSTRTNGYWNSQSLQSYSRQQQQQQHQQQQHQQQHQQQQQQQQHQQQHQQQQQQQHHQQQHQQQRRLNYDNVFPITGDNLAHVSDPRSSSNTRLQYEKQREIDVGRNRQKLEPGLSDNNNNNNNNRRSLQATQQQVVAQQSSRKPNSSLTLLSSNGGINYDGVIDFPDDGVIDDVTDNYAFERERVVLNAQNQQQQQQRQQRVGGRVYKSLTLLPPSTMTPGGDNRINYSDLDLYRIELNGPMTATDGTERRGSTPLAAGGGERRSEVSEPPSSSYSFSSHGNATPNQIALPPAATVYSHPSHTSGFVTAPALSNGHLATIQEADVTVTEHQQQQQKHEAEVIKMRRPSPSSGDRRQQQQQTRPASFPLTLSRDRDAISSINDNDEDIDDIAVEPRTSSRRPSVTSSVTPSSPYVARAMGGGDVDVAHRHSPLPYQQLLLHQQQQQQVLRNHRPSSVSSQSPHSAVRRLRFSSEGRSHHHHHQQQQQQPLVTRSLTNLNVARRDEVGYGSANGRVPREVSVRASYDSTLLTAKPPVHPSGGSKPPLPPALVRRSQSSAKQKESAGILVLTSRPSSGRSNSASNDKYYESGGGSYAPIGLPPHLHHLRVQQQRHQRQAQLLMPVSASSVASDAGSSIPGRVRRSSSHVSHLSHGRPRYPGDNLSVHSSLPNM